MSFWDSANRAFAPGVQLGERSAENEKRRMERETEREYQKGRDKVTDERNKAIDERESTKFQWESSDRQKKELYEKAEKSFLAANALYEAGETLGDEAQKRMAAKLLADTYNQHWVNGDEIKIIFKSDSAGNPKLAEKWDTDDNLKGKDVAILSKSGGLMPFKNLKDVFKFAAGGLNQNEFLAGAKLAEEKVALLNAKEEPFKGKDGHDYVQTWELGPGGIPRKGPVRAYTDVAKESEGQKKVREAETILGGKVTKGERRVLAGLAEKETATERVKREGVGKGEDALKISKALAELSEKERNIFKKDMDFVLRPFASKGTELFDEDGEMTPAANTALDEALQLIDKADAGKDLTPAEKKKLTHARRAWDMYNKISGKVAAGYEGKKTGGAGISWKDYAGSSATVEKGKGALRKKISIPKA